MITTYINPLGQTKTANLTEEQVAVLKTKEGFKVVDPVYEFFIETPVEQKRQIYNIALDKTNVDQQLADPFNDDKPAVSSKLTIHSASSEIGCAACSS